MQVRVALVSALFSKCLSLPISNSYSSGQITSFISADVQRFEDASGFLHFLWLGPLETLVVTYFVYIHIGMAAFAAIGVLLLLIPLQSALAKALSAQRKKTNSFQDDRIKSLTDMIAGMLVIKVFVVSCSYMRGNRHLSTKSKVSEKKRWNRLEKQQ